MQNFDNSYGGLILIDRSGECPEKLIERIPLGTPVSEGGIDESTLRDLLFKYPSALPIDSVDAAYQNPVAVCRELRTSAGYIDAVYITSLGRLVLAEFKLWRNPQARREVIGQILDYAKEFASWSYEDLQREVSKSLNRQGNVLYDLVRENSPDLDEAVFVDRVSRHLARGEFLLLIIGDGIQEGVKNIVEYVQDHSGLHFNLALVEAALYRDSSEHIIVHPRCLARTELIQRFVHDESDSKNSNIEEDDDNNEVQPNRTQAENYRFWKAVLDQYSFKDVTLNVPEVSTRSNITAKVRQSSGGDSGLSFKGFLKRKGGQIVQIGCYLTYKKGNIHAERIFEQIQYNLHDLQVEDEEIHKWEGKEGRHRIGFIRETELPFPNDLKNEEFDKAVAWMRDQLDHLVSTLHPKLKSLL